MRLLLALLALALAAPVAAQAGGEVLVFTRTEGFRHASIADGVAAIQALGDAHGFTVTHTEDAEAFSDDALTDLDAVVFLNTTGDVLDVGQQAAFERYVRGGGGFLGIHSAADTEYDWAWYGGLVGAYFASHPPGTPTATVKVVDRAHPGTAHLDPSWTRTDEWYNYRSNPRGDVHVLAVVDERTYAGGSMPTDHPIAWCQDYDGGRSFYTGGGHTEAAFAEPAFREHLWGGLAWAAGWTPGDCSATVETSWERTVLDGAPTDPMELAVAPDGRVFYVERGGAVKVIDPADGYVHVAARLPVTTSFEDGLLGIALDPDFAQSGWVYLYYSPSAGSVQRLSRFTLVGDVLDLGSEAVLLTVETDRLQGGHSGGSLAFAPDGTLFVATGDDTDPFASDGYTPIDERPGREAWDAQRTSGNPFDLRGKILRIRPMPDGTAAIPDGNLFPADGSEGRPEVYAMGVRNPFRLAVDPATGWLYWGDVGPDANASSSARGPRGYDEFNQARAAGHFGWPYCTADNRPYRDFDFATGISGPAFDCAATVNDSPNVAEAPVTLPPAVGAWAWYPYAPSPEFPEIPNGLGRTAMAGPVVRAGTPGGDALPVYFDGAAFFYEWSRNWIVETHLDADGRPLAFQRFLPGLQLNRPIDLELGPDGALYMLEWGSGFGGGNPDAAVTRIAYVRGTRAPVARLQASATDGQPPLTVSFTSDGTRHPDGLALGYAWDLDGDGTTDATTPEAEWTYTEAGTFTPRLTVTDPNGLSGTAATTVVVGNTRPVVTVTAPAEGGFFVWGDSLRFDVTVEDAEDGSTAAGTVACDRVVVQPGIGHDDHNHPLEEYPGCDGGFRTPDGHGADGENVFVVVEARYADDGAPPAGSLTGRRQIVLRPSRLEAEHFSDQRGVQFEDTGDAAGGGRNAGFIDRGDWLAFEPVDLTGIEFVTFRVASAGPGGRIDARADAPDGPLLATARVAPTGDWQVYKEVTVPITDPGGSRTLYLVFTSDTARLGLFNLNWIRFHGPGAAVPLDVPRGLRTAYFATDDLSGTAVERVDPQISFDWGEGAPVDGVPADGFSARWQATLDVPAAGRYVLTAPVEGGVRVWLDDELIIDAWDGEGAQTPTASTRLPAGPVALRMEYRAGGGRASAALEWSRLGSARVAVPYERLQAEAPRGTPAEPVQQGTLHLAPPRPNPANAHVAISFSLATPGVVRIEVFDLLGRRLQTVWDGHLAGGSHRIEADVAALPSGVYAVRLNAGGQTRTHRLTIVR